MEHSPYSIMDDRQLMHLHMGVRATICECMTDIEHAQVRLQMAKQTDKLISEEFARRFNATVDSE